MHPKKIANIEFFKNNLERFLADKLTAEKYLVIQDEAVQASFDTFDAALRFAAANYPADEFIVQQAIDETKIVSFVAAAS